MKHCLVSLALIALAIPCIARQGSFRAANGLTHAGDVVVGTNLLWIRPPAEGPAPIQIPLSEVVELLFEGNEPVTETATNAAPAAAPSDPLEGWNRTQIGGGTPGTAELEGDVWAVTGTGLGLRANADSGFLLERRLDVSGQISATLVAFDAQTPDAIAGLILRDNAGEAAAYAFVGQAGTNLCFQYRQIAGGMTMRVTNMVRALPTAVRLSRVGGAVVAEVSPDGSQWRQVGRANVNLGQSVRAGLLVAGGTPATVGPVTARFRQPIVGARGMGYVPLSGYPRVWLRGGSMLVAPIQSADESVLRLGGSLQGSLLSVMNVARVEFIPVTPELETRIEPDRAGALLVDGDFLESSLRRIVTNQVTMSSLLLGYRGFAAGSEVGVIQLGPVEPTESIYQVELRNGSDFRADAIELEPDVLRARSPQLGSIVVKPGEVRRIVRTEAQ